MDAEDGHNDVRAELKDVKAKLNEMCNYMKRGHDDEKQFIFPVRTVLGVKDIENKIRL